MSHRIISTLTLLLALSGCVSVDYAKLVPGKFTGSLFVMWVDEGGSSGDGVFVFVPDPNNRLTFHRADSSSPGAIIQPKMMYTDGGSIPKIAQVFKGLSPWGYAPAYMIHDWLFVARHCLVDGDKDPRYEPVRDVTFQDSVEILGEAIRALVAANRVKPDDVAAGAITTAVGSFVAKNLWNEKGACAASQVNAADRAKAEAAIPGSATFRKSLPNGAAPARIVARVSF